jgi:hypothetical protein
MPGRGAPTFLKRQKEQKRVARALAKRAAKQQRRENRAAGITSGDGVEEEISAEALEQDTGADSDPGTDGDAES